MALFLPPAVSVSRFQGGYKSVSDYTDLSDTETANALNVVYGPNGDIDQRLGSEKLLNQFLFASTSTATSSPITGHYFFQKQGGANTNSFNVVAAGDQLFSYTSATATVIRTGLTNNSNTFFDFIQVQDPRSAADDIVLMTNGAETIQVWNGSGSAVLLSGFTSATQVPICKYLVSHQQRVYALNVTDDTDADASVHVFRTGFGTDGNPDPHRFTENFFVGGSSRDGPIQGAETLNEQLIIYKRFSIWKFNPGSGDIGDLNKSQETIGLLAPLSLVDAGDFHIFLSDRGVFAFDGVNTVQLSEKIDNEFSDNANLSQLQFAKGVFDKKNNQYILYFASNGSSRNDRAVAYDIRPQMKVWQPPITGREVSFISTFVDSNNAVKIIYGDYLGYLYSDGSGQNDGLSTGVNGTTTTATVSTLTDSAADFSITNDGLRGLLLNIVDGTGVDQARRIISNTSETLTLESNWVTVPDSTSIYTVGGIDAHFQTKDYDFGGHDIAKLFRQMKVRTREEGSFDLELRYIIDFNVIDRATLARISLFASGFIWNIGIWDINRWGGGGTILRKVAFRSTSNQSSIGNHMALRFFNRRANQRFRLSGFDIELKAIGKR